MQNLVSGVHNLFEGFNEQPWIIVVVASLILIVAPLVELLCGAALVVGLLTRWVCIPLALLMLADILAIHPPSGYLVGDEEFEHAFFRLGASVALALSGPGKVALDNIIMVANRKGPK